MLAASSFVTLILRSINSSTKLSTMSLLYGIFPSSVNRSFSGRAVVAGQIDDEGVVTNAKIFDGIEHPADLVVCVCEKRSKDLHQATGNRLVPIWIVVPTRHLLWPGSERSSGWDHTRVELTLVDLTPKLIPTLIEQTRESFDPLRPHVMRSVDSRRSEITEERFVRRRSLRSVSASPLGPLSCRKATRQ